MDSLIDFHAAIGFGVSRFLLIGLGGKSSWFWLVLAGVGLVLAAASAGTESIEGFLKQMACVFLSALLLWGYKSVDLAEYSYHKQGVLEKELGTTKGGAILPTYTTFVLGRTLTASLKGVMSKGETKSVPQASVSMDLLATDPDVLDDEQLHTNLYIWNQLVAPYLLKADPTLESKLVASGLVDHFMVPSPNVEAYAAEPEKVLEVQKILAASSVDPAEMVCTLAPLIDSAVDKIGGSTWTGAAEGCKGEIKVPMTDSILRKALGWNPFLDRKAWDIGAKFASEMMAAGGNGQVQSVANFSALHEKIGNSILFVAGNHYRHDNDMLTLIGSACDKMTVAGDQWQCKSIQSGLVAAAKGVIKKESAKVSEKDIGIWEGIKRSLSGVAAYGTTGLFRVVMALLSTVVQEVIPYAMAVATTFALLVSVLGPYLLLWPGRFKSACGWMIGPVVWVSLWTIFHGMWVELDVWLTFAAGTLGWFNGGFMAKNVVSILISLGYMSIPFFAWSVVFGDAGKAISKATHFPQRAVVAGVAAATALTRIAARMAPSGSGDMRIDTSVPPLNGQTPPSSPLLPWGSGGGGAPSGGSSSGGAGPGGAATSAGGGAPSLGQGPAAGPSIPPSSSPPSAGGSPPLPSGGSPQGSNATPAVPPSAPAPGYSGSAAPSQGAPRPSANAGPAMPPSSSLPDQAPMPLPGGFELLPPDPGFRASSIPSAPPKAPF